MSDDARSPERPPNEDIDAELVEPDRVYRVSTYAVASFVVAIIGVAPGQPFFLFFVPRGASTADTVLALLSMVVPAGAAALALWLARRAELEIVSSDGRVGGVGFCRAARGVALLTMTLVAAGVLTHLLLREDPEPPARIETPQVELDPGVPEDFPEPPAPPAPARPVDP